MPTNAEIADRLAEDWSDAGLAECLDDLKDRIAAALTTAQAQAYKDAAKAAEDCIYMGYPDTRSPDRAYELGLKDAAAAIRQKAREVSGG